MRIGQKTDRKQDVRGPGRGTEVRGPEGETGGPAEPTPAERLRSGESAATPEPRALGEAGRAWPPPPAPPDNLPPARPKECPVKVTAYVLRENAEAAASKLRREWKQ